MGRRISASSGTSATDGTARVSTGGTAAGTGTLSAVRGTGHDLSPRVPAEDDALRLQVPVHHAVQMRLGHAVQDLQQQPLHLGEILERAAGPKALSDCLS
ncbi:MAG: hypothetical protein RL653_1855 [Pseudomonadota bacterium]